MLIVLIYYYNKANGCSFISFSIMQFGLAASALRAGKAIDKPVGQLIVAACVVDDILALILLSMFKVCQASSVKHNHV